MWKQWYFHAKQYSKTFITFVTAYSCCFSLEGHLDFPDFLQKSSITWTTTVGRCFHFGRTLGNQNIFDLVFSLERGKYFCFNIWCCTSASTAAVAAAFAVTDDDDDDDDDDNDKTCSKTFNRHCTFTERGRLSVDEELKSCQLIHWQKSVLFKFDLSQQQFTANTRSGLNFADDWSDNPIALD